MNISNLFTRAQLDRATQAYEGAILLYPNGWLGLEGIGCCRRVRSITSTSS